MLKVCIHHPSKWTYENLSFCTILIARSKKFMPESIVGRRSELKRVFGQKRSTPYPFKKYFTEENRPKMAKNQDNCEKSLKIGKKLA
jgi:hypothetical protein